MSKVTMIMGFPASGKTSLRKKLNEKGFVTLSRDEAGGRTLSLVPQMEELIKAGKDVVLDATFMQAANLKMMFRFLRLFQRWLHK